MVSSSLLLEFRDWNYVIHLKDYVIHLKDHVIHSNGLVNHYQNCNKEQNAKLYK